MYLDDNTFKLARILQILNMIIRAIESIEVHWSTEVIVG